MAARDRGRRVLRDGGHEAPPSRRGRLTGQNFRSTRDIDRKALASTPPDGELLEPFRIATSCWKPLAPPP